MSNMYYKTAKVPPKIPIIKTDIAKILKSAHQIFSGELNIPETLKSSGLASLPAAVIKMFTGQGLTSNVQNAAQSVLGNSSAGDLLKSLSSIFVVNALLVTLMSRGRYKLVEKGFDKSILELMNMNFLIERTGEDKITKNIPFSAKGLLDLLTTPGISRTNSHEFAIGQIDYKMDPKDFEKIVELGKTIERNNTIQRYLTFLPITAYMIFAGGRGMTSGNAGAGNRTNTPPGNRADYNQNDVRKNLPPGAGGSTDAPVVRFVPKK